MGDFSFVQVFPFEIPGIPRDECNSYCIFRLDGLTRPRLSRFKFRAKIRNKQKQNKRRTLCLFDLFDLLWS